MDYISAREEESSVRSAIIGGPMMAEESSRSSLVTLLDDVTRISVNRSSKKVITQCRVTFKVKPSGAQRRKMRKLMMAVTLPAVDMTRPSISARDDNCNDRVCHEKAKVLTGNLSPCGKEGKSEPNIILYVLATGG